MRRVLGPNPVFDRLLEGSVDVVLRGEHQRDEPPTEGGRWPVTVVCVPPQAIRARLDGLMREALVHAGPGHFLTGRPDSSHVTVRALEPYRDAAAPTDAVTSDWLAALVRAARSTPPLEFRLTGVTLTRGGVMAQLETVDDEPWAFMHRLRDELGSLAWYEDQWMERNIWYATLVHFAAPLLDAKGLVDWVGRHRAIEPVEFIVDAASLVRSRHRWHGESSPWPWRRGTRSPSRPPPRDAREPGVAFITFRAFFSRRRCLGLCSFVAHNAHSFRGSSGEP